VAVFVARRLLWLLGIVLGISLLTFVVSHLIPADPARYAAGLQATPEQVAQVRHELGLDRPLPEQYLRYLAGLTHGDFGYSISTHRPVLADLTEFLPATLELVVVALGLMLLLGIPSGVVSAVGRGAVADYATRLFAVLGAGMPIFWLALMGQLLLYYRWGLLPSGGRVDQSVGALPAGTGFLLVDSLAVRDLDLFRQAVVHLIMPACVLALDRTAVVVRLTRAALLDTLGQDFVRTARAKGIGSLRIMFKHTLRPSLIPIVTESATQFGWMIGGTVIVESIFSWPGVGLYAFSAIQNQDLPAIMGVTVALTCWRVLANLAADVLYIVLDPRVTYR
jgi:peptide/nickel transport system permease protein